MQIIVDGNHGFAFPFQRHISQLLCQVSPFGPKRTAFLSGFRHEALNGLFQTIEGKLVHGEYLLNGTDGHCAGPLPWVAGVKPHGLFLLQDIDRFEK